MKLQVQEIEVTSKAVILKVTGEVTHHMVTQYCLRNLHFLPFIKNIRIDGKTITIIK